MWKVVGIKVGKNRVGKTKGRREERAEKERKEKTKKKRMIEVKKVTEEWEIWDEEEEAVKSEEVAKMLVQERFYKWIQIFSKKSQ